jgi:thiamine-phosphate pyrophosphorylase
LNHPARPLLYYITGERPVVAAALAAGVDLVQIRAKNLATGALLQWVREAAARPRSGKLLVNERLDVALAAGADGLHLPAGRPPASAWRVRDSLVIGVSCHTTEEVERAAGEGADFAVLGPIFVSPGKGAPLGLGPLEAASRAVIPVLALGGVTAENAAQCLAAGAAGIAGIRLFEEAADLAELVRQLRET